MCVRIKPHESTVEQHIRNMLIHSKCGTRINATNLRERNAARADIKSFVGFRIIVDNVFSA